MPELTDGESAEVQGSGANSYTISRNGEVYSCTCPAWRNQRLRIEQRTCKHIRAYRGGYSLSYTPPLPDASAYEEAPEIRARRDEVLNKALERYVVLYDKMEEIFGLRMPEQLAYAAGFFLGLSQAERAWLTDGAGLLGPATWFDDDEGSHAKKNAKNVSDERLRDRARDDPPELVSVLSAKGGERYGFWYDDPKELPTAAAHRAAGNNAETRLLESSLLSSMFHKLRESIDPYAVAEQLDLIGTPVLAWMSEVARREAGAERSPLWIRRDNCNGGPTPFVPGWTIPDDLSSWLEQHKRMNAYTARAPIVQEWIAQALQEIRDGAPGRALLLGHELHWFDAPEWRSACSELLIRGYSALGRRALADIVRAHYMDRDPDVPVFELPPAHAIIAAAASGDAEEIARALEEGAPPSPEEIAEALAASTTVDGASAILDLDGTQTDSALWRRLVEMTTSKGEEARTARAVVLLLVTRGTVNARAFGRILETNDDELIDLATAHVELFSEDARGRTPLHFAAGVPNPKVTRALLDRGADARAEDSSGRIAYESAREAWRAHPREAGEIFAMLEAAGGSPKKTASPSEAPPLIVAPIVRPPPRPVEVDFEWTEGVKVHHAKLKDGVVEAVVGGEGDDTKLKIRFENETRILLAKFVTHQD